MFNQITSLFKLPFANSQADAAAAQAKAVQARLAATQPKASAPVAPVAPQVPQQPQNNQKPPQIDAINRILTGTAGVLQDMQKTLAQPAPAPTPPPTPAPDNFAPIEQDILSNIGPSAEETDLQKRLSNIMASRDLGLIEAEKAPIPLQAIMGEQGRIERRAAVQAGTLKDQLALLQAKRQAALDAGKARYDIEEKRYERTKPDEEKISEFTNEKGEKVVAFRDKKTGKIRQETLGAAKAATSSVEQKRQMTTKAIGIARPILIGSKGTDGYVNPNTYLKLRNDYAEAIGNPADFDATFAPMLSPSERTRLGVGRVINPPKSADDIESLLADYLSS